MTIGSAAVPTGRISPFAVFRKRNFTLMWSGQLVSTIGTALTSLAASILVFRETDSAFSVGLMLIATAAPSLLVGLFAGVYVDRYDRRRIMIAADLIRAVLVFMLPFLIPLGLAWLYIIVLLTSAVGQFFDPAHEALLPEIASDEELAAANSMMAISSFGSTAIGFAAAGLIASAANINWAFYLDALTFLVSAVCIFLIRIKPLPVDEATSTSSVLTNVRAGMKTLFDTPILRSLFLVSIPMLVAFGLSNSLLLPFALRALQATEFEYGIQEALTSVGFVIGSLLMASIFNRMREGPWIAISLIGMALAGMAYSFSASIGVAYVILAISGFLNAPAAIGRRLVIQRNTPREMRGRVNSAFFVSRSVLFMLGMAAAGLADVVDVRVVYFFAAVLVLFSGLWVLVLPGLRQEAAEWRRAIHLLRSAPAAAPMGIGRPALPTDLDALVGLLPTLGSLSSKERQSLLIDGTIFEADSGRTVVRQGEASDAAYFILSGKLVAGFVNSEGEDRYLSTMSPGDFFGEIAALSGAQRTANVVAEEASTLLQVRAETLRTLMSNPALSALFLSTMNERLNRTTINELPRFASPDPQMLRDLRTAPVEG